MNRNSERAILIRQRSSAEGCAIAALFSAIIIIIGIFLGFQTNWWVFLASLAAAVVVGISVAVKKSFAGTEAFEQQCREHSVSFQRSISSPTSGLFIGISEAASIVLLSFRISDHQVRDVLINLHEVLDVELSIDNTAEYQAGPIATLSGAALGGITFGGTGAIVGSLATAQIGKGKISTMALKLRITDLDVPFVQTDFIFEPSKISDAGSLLTLAENWTNLIEVMRYRIAQSDHQ